MSQTTDDVYAFEVKENWDPRPNATGQWSVRKGDIGWVKGTAGNGGWVDIQLLDSNRRLITRGGKTNAWIPDHIITRGKKSGNVLTSMKAPEFKIPLPPVIADSNFERALVALLKRMANERTLLNEKGASPVDLENIGKEWESIRGDILRAIPDVSIPALKMGNLEFDHLWNTLPAISMAQNIAGIYIILYRNVERSANGTFSHAWYIGKSINLQQRMIQHIMKIKNPPSVGGKAHYAIGSKASTYKFAVLAQFPSNLSRLGFRLKVAEHCFVSMFDSWNPRVLVRPSTITEYGNGGRDVQAAIAFSDLARDTFQQLGCWPVTTPVKGCNWKTPITEGSHYDGIPWTSTYIPDTPHFIPKGSKEGTPTRMRVFYRQPTKVQELPNKSLFIMLFQASAFQEFGGMSITLPQNVGIQKGMLVQLVCEVMLDGSAHPHPWARLPDVGAFSGYRLLNTLGIRVVFQQPNNKWVSCPVQMIQFFDNLDNVQAASRYNGLPEKDFLSRAYLKPSILLDALMRVHYDTDKLPKWKWNTRNLTIKNVHYNHLEQEIQVTDMPPWFLEIPVLQTMQQNWQRLHDQYPGIVIGAMRPGVFSTFGESYGGGSTRRDRCDVCFIHHLRGNDLVRMEKSAGKSGLPCKPIQHEGMTTCWRCLTLKRPCTWTKASDILAKGWQSLAVLPEVPYTLTEVPNPTQTTHFTGLPQDDVEAEDDEAGDAGEI